MLRAYEMQLDTDKIMKGGVGIVGGGSVGGEAIASGGYGCVLRPALKCQGDADTHDGMISKLMNRGKAMDEMKEVDSAKKALSKIPNYDKYFAVTGYKMCVPAKLSEEDKKNFGKECSSPLRAKFNQVNKHLHEFRALISPDLGMDVSKSIKTIFGTMKGKKNVKNVMLQLIRLNEAAIDLLQNGVSKMSSVGFYHSDVKPQNILTDFDPKRNADDNFTYMKLIDYGLALPHNAEWRDVNNNVLFNFPISAFMFDRYNVESINRKLERSAKKHNMNTHRYEFENDFKYQFEEMIDNVFNSRGFSHLSYMIYLGAKAYSVSEDEYKLMLKQFYIEYCSEIIFEFLDAPNRYKPTFDIEKYWNDVYRHNLDVWGLLTTFLILGAEASKRFKTIAAEYKPIVSNYLYNIHWAAKPIPVDKVVADIEIVTVRLRNSAGVKDPAHKHLIANVKHNTPISVSKPRIIQHKSKSKSKSADIKMINLTSKPRLTIKKKAKVIKIKSIQKHTKSASQKHQHNQKQSVSTSYSKMRGLNTITLSSKRKRCPKGYRRHKTIKTKCVKMQRK